jgi:hypothetical protein
MSKPALCAWMPVNLPYIANKIPTRLPSDDEIFNSPEILQSGFRRRVVGIGEHFVVKHGPGTEEREGQTLLFLEQQYSSPSIPRLYAMYRRSNGHLCIIMQRMPGDTLEKLWPTLNETEKTDISNKTKAILDNIRQISGHFYGSVDRGPIHHQLLWTAKGDSAISGPFTTEKELNVAFAKQLQGIYSINSKHCYKADFYMRRLDEGLRGHRPVLTHGDIQRKNIMVLRVVDDFNVSIVDWEFAGWYPSYWEYSAMFAAMPWADDWPVFFEKILEPCVAEAAIIRMIYQEIIF